MISSFQKLNRFTNVGKGGIICTSNNLKELTSNNQIIPISTVIS